MDYFNNIRDDFFFIFWLERVWAPFKFYKRKNDFWTESTEKN